ncbi:hypothetical protein E2C01_072156 [Portunus trituberculatus]|uniref:Uncharacterized protein n=1 Tax=Portunus trituberculatus TaxID=210409 RepID=A0A5B7IAB7_PORTR|nr:hypothetical protein [Portunus trituberculatus]
MRRSGEQREAADPPVPRGFPDALPAGGGDTTAQRLALLQQWLPESATRRHACRSLPPRRALQGVPDRAYSQFLRECRAVGGGATRLHPRETIAPLRLPRPGPPQDA